MRTSLTRKSLIRDAGETRAWVGQIVAVLDQVQQSGAQLLPDWPKFAGDFAELCVYWTRRDTYMRQLIDLDEELEGRDEERNAVLRAANAITRPSNSKSFCTSTLRPNHSRLSAITFEIENTMRIRQSWQAKLDRLSDEHDGKVRRTDECLTRITALIKAASRESVQQPSVRGSDKRPPKTKTHTTKEKVIFGAIQAKLKGPEYCAELDRKKISVPSEWVEKGCPDKYVKAYREEGWQSRIHNEKHRAKKKYDAIPANQREAIIQGNSPTRRTRH